MEQVRKTLETVKEAGMDSSDAKPFFTMDVQVSHLTTVYLLVSCT